MSETISIAEETPLQDDVRALVAELDAAIREMEPETPDALNFKMTAEEMAQGDITLFVARRDGAALGCCALKRRTDALGEIKRMYVRPEARGLRLGELLLDAVEERAAGEGIRRLVLETGYAYHAAHRVYERAGYTRCAAFADYPDTSYSFFYDKALDEIAPARRPDISEARP